MIHIENSVNPIALNFLCMFAENVMRNRLPTQVIQRDDSPYINRWMLARKNFVPEYDNGRGAMHGLFPSEMENLYLHAYARGDQEAPHCHPWSNASLVIRGYYDEERYGDNETELISLTRCRAGDIILRPPSSIHAIVNVSDDCLTLFATSKKERDWGYYENGKFIPALSYTPNTVA
jgi:hypothetical protein